MADYPVQLNRFWYGLPSFLDSVDAVYERPGDGRIVFFKGQWQRHRWRSASMAQPAALMSHTLDLACDVKGSGRSVAVCVVLVAPLA